jgi:PAS domain S-box-containing protein
MSSIHQTITPSIAGDLTQDPLLAALLEQVQVGIVIAARDGQFEYVNASAVALIEEQRRGRLSLEPWAALAQAPASELGPIHWIIARALLTGETIREEDVEYLDSHDEWRTLSVSATPIRDARGEVDRALVSFVDVTLRNRARDWEPVMRSLSRL